MNCRASLVRGILQLSLFGLYWSFLAGSYPFAAGPVFFILLFGGSAWLARRAEGPLRGAAGATAALIGLFVAGKLLQAPLARLPLPWDFAGVFFASLGVLTAGPLLGFLWLRALAERFPRFYGAEVLLYGSFLIVLPGSPAWNLKLVRGSLFLSFLFLLLCAACLLLLLLARGRRLFRFSLPAEGIPLVLLGLLLLLPLGRLYRSESVKEGGGLLESSLFHFDFTDYLTLESRVSMKDELVFLLQKEGPGEKIFLRRYVLAGYEQGRGFFREPGKTWEAPGRLLPDYTIPEGPLSWDVPAFARREEQEQSLYYINFDPSAFLGMNLPERAVPYAGWEGASFSRIYRVYSAVGRIPDWEKPFALDAAEEPGEGEFSAYYTAYGEQEDLRLLAEEITRGRRTRYAKAQALEEHFKEEYLYSLRPGTAPRGDQLRYFLFDSKKGYCSYFAFSMALLCRSIGIPARVALGFRADTAGAVLSFYPVNANQAHAWVEVFFPDAGWVEFDPTSDTLAPGESFEFSRYDPEELEPYIREILSNRDRMRVADLSARGSGGGGAPGTLRRSWNRIRSNPGLLLPIAGVLWFATALLRLAAAFSGLPRRAGRIRRFYGVHRTFLLLGRPPGCRSDMTPRELADWAARRGGRLFPVFTEEYLRLRFGKAPEGEARWFRRGRGVRREIAALLGAKGTLRALGLLLLRPGRRV